MHSATPSFCVQHCTTCFNRNCNVASPECELLPCPNKCGMKMHGCKVNDHTLGICPLEIVSCINKQCGCPLSLRRSDIFKHMNTCPANVMYCRIMCTVPCQEPIVETTYIDPVRSGAVSPFIPPISPAPQIRGCNEKPTYSGEDSDDITNGDGGKNNKDSEKVPLPPVIDCVPIIPTNEFLDQPLSVLFPDEHIKGICGKLIPRACYSTHYQLHSDVLCQLDGSIELQCPLRFFGCPYVTVRLRPNQPTGRLVYNPYLRCFALRYISLVDGVAEPVGLNPVGTRESEKSPSTSINLANLPDDLLFYLTSFLDNVSLTCLSAVSQRLRRLTKDRILLRLVVTPKWKRIVYRPARTHWKMENFIWSIPDRTDSIFTWCLTSGRAEMAVHMRTCPYNKAVVNEKPFSTIPFPSK